MLDVTVILLDDGYASTALMPIEIFHSAGALWPEIRGETPEPRFRVTTALWRPGNTCGSEDPRSVFRVHSRKSCDTRAVLRRRVVKTLNTIACFPMLVADRGVQEGTRARRSSAF